jgi:hypothetical protein
MEERRLIAFNRVPDELKYPPNDKEQQGPTPVEEKQWQGNDDQRDANAVRELVKRVTVLRFVGFDEGHSYSLES